MVSGAEAQWLGKLGRKRLTSSMVAKRCRDCQAPVRWVETTGGWKVKLDYHPVTGGAWAINVNGIAWQVDRKHANQGVYSKHVCEGS